MKICIRLSALSFLLCAGCSLLLDAKPRSGETDAAIDTAAEDRVETSADDTVEDATGDEGENGSLCGGGFKEISAGFLQTCALLSDGRARCWGANGFGQLGDGTTTPSSTPVDVQGLGGDVIDVATGGYHSCAVTSAGAVMCWGQNNHGQLGDGTTTPSLTAVPVLGLSSGVQHVELGETHTCAITAGGGVKCWGYNNAGQLGNGTTVSSAAPVDVDGLSSGVEDMGTGRNHACVVMTSGGVKCWGYNVFGAMGDGTTDNSRSSPVEVLGISAGAIAVDGGRYHTCALMSAGGITCWGSNHAGSLGSRASPASVVGIAGAFGLTVGNYHGCAITTSSGILCWGRNENGECGDGTTTGRSLPVAVIGMTAQAISMSALGNYTCALTEIGAARCWGLNDDGQLGDGTTTPSSTPVDVVCR